MLRLLSSCLASVCCLWSHHLLSGWLLFHSCYCVPRAGDWRLMTLSRAPDLKSSLRVEEVTGGIGCSTEPWLIHVSWWWLEQEESERAAQCLIKSCAECLWSTISKCATSHCLPYLSSIFKGTPSYWSDDQHHAIIFSTFKYEWCSKELNWELYGDSSICRSFNDSRQDLLTFTFENDASKMSATCLNRLDRLIWQQVVWAHKIQMYTHSCNVCYARVSWSARTRFPCMPHAQRRWGPACAADVHFPWWFLLKRVSTLNIISQIRWTFPVWKF